MQNCHLRKEPALRDWHLFLQCCMTKSWSPPLSHELLKEKFNKPIFAAGAAFFNYVAL